MSARIAADRRRILREGRACTRINDGTVSERPKVHVSKTCVGESPPWVQIPPVPPKGSSKYCSKYSGLEIAFAVCCGRFFISVPNFVRF